MEVPGSLQWVFVIIGGDFWPNGDPGAVRTFAGRWDTVGDRLTAAGHGFTELTSTVADNMTGGGGRAFTRFGGSLAGVGAEFAAMSRQQGASLRDYANSLENAQYSMIIQMAWTAAELLWALSDPFTEPLVPEIIGMARLAITETLERFLGEAATEMVLAAAWQSVVAGLQPLLASAIQVAQHHVDHIDVTSIAAAMGFGALGGILGSKIQKGLGHAMPKFGGNWAGSAVSGATIGAVMGATQLGIGGDPNMVWTSAVNGGVTGAAHHVAAGHQPTVPKDGNAHVPPAPKEVTVAPPEPVELPPVELPPPTPLSGFSAPHPAPPPTVDELVHELNTATGEHPMPSDDTALLGPDLFGLLQGRPVPDFLAGNDYHDLSAGKGIDLLDGMNMTGDWQPGHPADLAPDALNDHQQYTTTHHRTDEQLTTWAPGNVPPLPADSATPRLLHAFWAGGPLHDDGGAMADFRANFGEIGKRNESVAVLWTDVPRAKIAEGTDPAVQSMVSWAKDNNVRLVNVHEVFNAENPMHLQAFFNAELTKQTGPGYAAASDIARLEILHRFGGAYIDGGDVRVRNVSELFEAANTPAGFAIHASGGKYGNDAFVMSKGHPFAKVYLDQILANYRKPQQDLLKSAGMMPASFFDTPMGRVHRNSVMARTGPNVLGAVARELGYADPLKMPRIEGVGMASAGSWLKPAPVEPVHHDHAATVELTQKVVQTLVRDMYNRGGDLHLTAVEPAVTKHHDPNLVWTAALSYIAAHPDLAGRVTSVTDHKLLNQENHHVQLPPEARALLNISADEPRSWLGETMRPATINPPAHREPPAEHTQEPTGNRPPEPHDPAVEDAARDRHDAARSRVDTARQQWRAVRDEIVTAARERGVPDQRVLSDDPELAHRWQAAQDALGSSRSALVHASRDLVAASAPVDRPTPKSPLDDPSWLHSGEPTAPWFEPHHTPVSAADIVRARADAPVSEVHGELRDVWRDNTKGLGFYHTDIGYDRRTFTVRGMGVQDYTVRIHLRQPAGNGVPPDVVAGMKSRADQGVQRFFNQGNRLPSGDQFHVTVEFVDDPHSAHAVIDIVDSAKHRGSDSSHWWTGASDVTYTHEIGHLLGLNDEYVDRGTVFQQPGSVRTQDKGLMTSGMRAQDAALMPRDLYLVETRANALGSLPEPASSNYRPDHPTATNAPNTAHPVPTAAPDPRLTSDYTVRTSTDQRPFQGHEPLRVPDPNSADTRIENFPAFIPTQHEFDNAEPPPLRVADDATLAINGTHPFASVVPMTEAKEFYATRDVFDAAVRDLRQARAGADLVLDPETSIVVNRDGTDVTLYRVTATFRSAPPDVCRDFAANVLGGYPDTLVFGNAEHGVALARTNATEGLELTGTHHLAAEVADVAHADGSLDHVDPWWAATAVRQDIRAFADHTADGRPLPGERYGQALGHRRVRSNEVARQIGINQFADARVGEGYVSNSIAHHGTGPTPRAMDRNFASDNPVGRAVFGYHFATVVARSTDHGAQITLENYARTGGFKRAVGDALDRTATAYHGRFDDVIDHLQQRLATTAPDAAERPDVQRRLELANALRDMANTPEPDRATQRAAYAAMAKLTSARIPNPNALWHFKMYTNRPGESFHEQEAKFYDEHLTVSRTNPLTAVVAGGRQLPRTVTIDFPEGAHEIDPAAVARPADQIARIAVWRREKALPLPEVTVTGFGNGTTLVPGSAHASGLDRARNVHDAFRAQLETTLAALQENQPAAGRVTVDHIPITYLSRGRNAPPDPHRSRDDARRRATIEFSDPGPLRSAHSEPPPPDETALAQAHDLLAMHGVVDTYAAHGVALSDLTELVADVRVTEGESAATGRAAALGTAVDILDRNQVFGRLLGREIDNLVRDVSALIEAGDIEAAERFAADAVLVTGGV